MNNSELVTTQHLARKAIIYIRQSTPHQVLSNQESLRLQYALEQRALSLCRAPTHPMRRAGRPRARHAPRRTRDLIARR